MSDRSILFVFDSVTSPQMESWINQLIQVFHQRSQSYPCFVMITRNAAMFSGVGDRFLVNQFPSVRFLIKVYALLEIMGGLGYLTFGIYGPRMDYNANFNEAIRVFVPTIIVGMAMLILQMSLFLGRRIASKVRNIVKFGIYQMHSGS